MREVLLKFTAFTRPTPGYGAVPTQQSTRIVPYSVFLHVDLVNIRPGCCRLTSDRSLFEVRES